jgi:hypothetical protein
MTDDSVTTMRTLLTAAGLKPTEPEIVAYAAAYPDQRAAADALYAVPAARYVDPALRFRAESRLTDW